MTSNNAALTILVNFAMPSGVGTTTLGSLRGGQMNVITMSGATVLGSWFATDVQGSGTLTINTLTGTGASGTFSFMAPPAPAGSGAGATGTKVVTSGVFNVTF